MYRIVIADDEQWICKWLASVIVSSRTDMEIVGVADNGREALSMIRNENADIVVSDIKMPFISGLDLIKTLRAEGCTARFIFISGYEDFSYAKEAIRQDASDYLLKPIDRKQLREALDRAVASLKERRSEAGDSVLVDNSVFKILRSLVLENEISELPMIKGLLMKIGFSYSCITAGLIQPGYSISAGGKIRQELCKRFSEVFSDCRYYIMLKNDLTVYYFLFCNGRKTDRANGLECIVSDFDKANLGKIHPGGWIEKIENLPSVLAEIESSLTKGNKQNNGEFSARLGEVKARLLMAVDTKNTEGLNAYIREVRQSDLMSFCSVEEVKVMFFGLINEVLKRCELLDVEQFREFQKKGFDFCIRIYSYYSVGPMFEWIAQYLTDITSALGAMRAPSVPDMVKLVVKTVRERYSEDLGLSQICDELGINVSYFSKRFKEETGENFIDMLTDVRMEVAKGILLNTDATLSETAEKVGLNNAKYFSRVFIKKTGMLPSQFRETFRK